MGEYVYQVVSPGGSEATFEGASEFSPMSSCIGRRYLHGSAGNEPPEAHVRVLQKVSKRSTCGII